MTYLCILNYNNVIKEIQLEVNKGAMLPLMEEYTIQGEVFTLELPLIL
jgi:hypothetical protein